MYVIADPDLLKHIMVKDFSHFVDRIPVSVSLFFFSKLFISTIVILVI